MSLPHLSHLIETLSTYVEQLKSVKFDDVSNVEKLLLEEEEDEEEEIE